LPHVHCAFLCVPRWAARREALWGFKNLKNQGK
jgi:hypothetical protein